MPVDISVEEKITGEIELPYALSQKENHQLS